VPHDSPIPAAAHQNVSYLPFESTNRDPNDSFVPRTASSGEHYAALKSAIAALDLVDGDPVIGPLVRNWFEQDHLQANTLSTDPRYAAWYRRAAVLDAEIWATRAPTVGGTCWKLREVLLGLVAEEMTDGSTYRAAKSAFLDLEAMWRRQRAAAAADPLVRLEAELHAADQEDEAAQDALDSTPKAAKGQYRAAKERASAAARRGAEIEEAIRTTPATSLAGLAVLARICERNVCNAYGVATPESEYDLTDRDTLALVRGVLAFAAAAVPPVESPLVAIEREVARFIAIVNGSELGVDRDPVAIEAIGRADELDVQITDAPVRSLADAAVKMRRALDPQNGLQTGASGDGFRSLLGVLAFLENLTGGCPAGVIPGALHPQWDDGDGSAEVLPFSVAAE